MVRGQPAGRVRMGVFIENEEGGDSGGNMVPADLNRGGGSRGS
jgi:hypothetical protein